MKSLAHGASVTVLFNGSTQSSVTAGGSASSQTFLQPPAATVTVHSVSQSSSTSVGLAAFQLSSHASAVNLGCLALALSLTLSATNVRSEPVSLGSTTCNTHLHRVQFRGKASSNSSHLSSQSSLASAISTALCVSTNESLTTRRRTTVSEEVHLGSYSSVASSRLSSTASQSSFKLATRCWHMTSSTPTSQPSVVFHNSSANLSSTSKVSASGIATLQHRAIGRVLASSVESDLGSDPSSTSTISATTVSGTQLSTTWWWRATFSANCSAHFTSEGTTALAVSLFAAVESLFQTVAANDVGASRMNLNS